MRGSNTELMLDDDNVGKVEAARGHRRHQRQRIFCHVAQSEATELAPGKRVEKRGHEGRIETPRLRHDALERSDTTARLVGCAQSHTRNAEYENPELQGNRRPGRVEQNRDCGQHERDAPCENRRYRERILHHKERDRPGKHQRQIGYDELEPAMPVFYPGRAEDDRRQDR